MLRSSWPVARTRVRVGAETRDEKTRNEKTWDEKTRDEKTRDEKTWNEKSWDEKTRDEKTRDGNYHHRRKEDPSFRNQNCGLW